MAETQGLASKNLQTPSLITILLLVSMLLLVSNPGVSATQPAAVDRVMDSVAPEMEVVDRVQIGGLISALALADPPEDQRLYAAIGSRIDVYDVEDAAQPRFLASSPPMPAQAEALWVEDGLLYAALYRGGVYIFDVAGSEAPVLISMLPEASGAVASMVLHRGHLWLADRSLGLVVIDVRDPRSPRLVNRHNFEARDGSGTLRLRDLALGGENLALVADNPDDSSQFEIIVLDASDPSVSREIGSVGIESSNPNGLIWQAAHLYLGSGYGLHVLDLLDPTQPEEIGLVTRPEGLRVSGLHGAEDRLYQWAADGPARVLLEYGLADPARPLVVALHENEPWGAVLPAGRRLYNYNNTSGALIGIYERQGEGLHRVAGVDLAGNIINASGGAERTWFTSQLGIHSLDEGADGPAILRWSSDWQAFRMAMRSDRLYAAAGRDGLRSLDLSDPSMPRELEPVPLTASSVELRNLMVDGDRGYAIAWRGRGGLPSELWLLDLRPETGPERISVLEVDLGWNDMPQLAIVGDYLLISSDSGPTQREIIAVDVSDAAAPRELLRLLLEDHVWALVADRSSRFYAGTDTAIIGFEISDQPFAIVERTRWQAGEAGEERSILGIAVEEDGLVAVSSARAVGSRTAPIDSLGHSVALLRFQLASDGRLIPFDEMPLAVGTGGNRDRRPFFAGRWIGVPGTNLGLNLVLPKASLDTPRIFLPLAWNGE
jgi:hypothetical protein